MKLYNLGRVLFLLLILVSIGASWADVIEPGEKNVPFTYQIINMHDYPGYVFILHGTPNPSFELLNSSEFSFYKLSVCSIYAVPETVFNSVKLEMMNDTQIDAFLNNDSRVARSNITLDGLYGTVNVADPLESGLIQLRINSIQGNDLDIQKEKIIYYYTNGQNVEKPFQSQNQIPEPTVPGPSWDYYLYFIVLPILALAAIFYIIMRRRSN